jgi:signal transduction histidine kinase
MPDNVREQISNIIAIVIVYIAMVYILYPLWGETVVILSMLPVIMVAWQYGLMAGFLSGLLFFPFNTLLLNLIARSGWDVLIRESGTLMGSFLLLVVGIVVGSMRDMNEEQKRMSLERKRAEEKIAAMLQETQKVNEELKRTDKAKDEFLSIVTHDLELPLVSVLGYSEVLLQGILGQVSEKQKSAVEVIHKHGKILQGMIDSILDYTRLAFEKVKLESEVFSINSLMAEMLREMNLQFEGKKITLHASLPKEDIMVDADKGMVRRIFANLLGNAVRHTPEGGRVEVTIDKNEEMVRVSVQDNGVGIPKKRLSKIFDKFYIIKDEQARLSRRLGLGLYIAKNFVEVHGGKIWAESEGEGKGARFIFTLPTE